MTASNCVWFEVAMVAGTWVLVGFGVRVGGFGLGVGSR